MGRLAGNESPVRQGLPGKGMDCGGARCEAGLARAGAGMHRICWTAACPAWSSLGGPTLRDVPSLTVMPGDLLPGLRARWEVEIYVVLKQTCPLYPLSEGFWVPTLPFVRAPGSCFLPPCMVQTETQVVLPLGPRGPATLPAPKEKTELLLRWALCRGAGKLGERPTFAGGSPALTTSPRSPCPRL